MKKNKDNGYTDEEQNQEYNDKSIVSDFVNVGEGAESIGSDMIMDVINEINGKLDEIDDNGDNE